MSKGMKQTTDAQPVTPAVFRVQFDGCPPLCLEAYSEADAAGKYRDYFDLHFTRQPKVERVHGGNR